MKDKIIWKEQKGTFGTVYQLGYMGKLCLFQYSYCYIEKKDREKPYLLQVHIGINEHNFRYATAEEAIKGADRLLKFIKEQLK
jgi:hypothetical protein